MRIPTVLVPDAISAAIGMLAVAACLLWGCSATETAVADGQLFCAKSSTLTVAIETAAGPYSVIGQSAATVAGVCALIDAIPVDTPANASSVPTVTVTLPTTNATPTPASGSTAAPASATPAPATTAPATTSSGS